MSRFNPTEELEAVTPDVVDCPRCHEEAKRTFVRRAQLLGWQSDWVTYRCEPCAMSIRLTFDAVALS